MVKAMVIDSTAVPFGFMVIFLVMNMKVYITERILWE